MANKKKKAKKKLLKKTAGMKKAKAVPQFGSFKKVTLKNLKVSQATTKT